MKIASNNKASSYSLTVHNVHRGGMREGRRREREGRRERVGREKRRGRGGREGGESGQRGRRYVLACN